MNSNKGARKLLAINFGGLGDEVLFLPTLQSIKSAEPSLRITLLTEPRGRGIAQVSDLIDENICFDIKKRPLKPADYLELIGLLKKGNYDVVVSSGSSPQVSGLLFLSGIKVRVGYGSNKLAPILLTNPVPLNRDQHAACMYNDLTRGLGINSVCSRPQVKVDPEARRRMQDLLGTTSGAKHVLIHPGTSRLAIEKGIIKTWSPDNWTALIERLLEQQNVRVILSGGPDDAETIAQIEAGIKGSPTAQSGAAEGRFVQAFGKTANLQDLVALIDLADLLVCVDSAPMHLGVGLDKRLVALFGPTDPAKLLWNAPQFIALRDEEAARKWAGKDPFMQPRKRSPESPSLQPEPYVQIPLDTVFRTVQDQLSQV